MAVVCKLRSIIPEVPNLSPPSMFRPTAFSTLRRGFATQLLPTSKSPISPSLSFFNSVTGDDTQIPTYRVLDGVGKPIEGAEIPEVSILLCIAFLCEEAYTNF